MIQVALLLLGCALSSYLWGINTTIASAILRVTLFGVMFYLPIVVAGAVSVNCPCQTPGSRVLLAPAYRTAVRRSHTFLMFQVNVEYHQSPAV